MVTVVEPACSSLRPTWASASVEASRLLASREVVIRIWCFMNCLSRVVDGWDRISGG